MKEVDPKSTSWALGVELVRIKESLDDPCFDR